MPGTVLGLPSDCIAIPVNHKLFPSSNKRVCDNFSWQERSSHTEQYKVERRKEIQPASRLAQGLATFPRHYCGLLPTIHSLCIEDNSSQNIALCVARKISRTRGEEAVCPAGASPTRDHASHVARGLPLPYPPPNRAPAVAAGRCEASDQRRALRGTAGVGALWECGRRRAAQDAKCAEHFEKTRLTVAWAFEGGRRGG